MEGRTPGWSTVGARAARGMRGAPLGPCLPRGPAPFPWFPRGSLLPVCRDGPRCAGPLPCGPCGRPGRRPPGCSRCRASSYPGSSPAPPRSAGRRTWLRAPPWAVLRYRGRVGGVAWGTSLLRCSGPVSTRGRGWARCPPAAWVLWARCRRGALELSPGRSANQRAPGGVLVPASEYQRLDDLVCRVQRRRPGACFAWGHRLRHCCVAVPKSRGWCVDFPRLVHVLWVQRGLGGELEGWHRGPAFACSCGRYALPLLSVWHGRPCAVARGV